MSSPSNSRVPEAVDAWRMVAARKVFEGRIPLAAMARLRDGLVDAEGEVGYTMEFGTDARTLANVDGVRTVLLQVRRQSGTNTVEVVPRVKERIDELARALPPGYEALLVADDGMLKPAELVEDELILALPVVPVSADVEEVEREFAPTAEEVAQASPFAALAGLKKGHSP